MKNKSRGVSENCGNSLVKPYINDQVLTKIYGLECALQYGTLFPELNLFDSNMYNAQLYSTPSRKQRGRK